MKTTTPTTPALHLEQARLGERPLRETDASAVAALRENDAAFLAALPAAVVVPQVEAEARRRAGLASASTATATSAPHALRWRRWLAVAAPPCAAAALVVMLQRPAEEPVVVDNSAPEVVRAKGAAAVLLATHVTASGAVPLLSGERLAAGDVLQLGWQVTSTSMFPKGVVVSIDGRGTVTQHLPLPPSTAAPVLSARGLLPSSYELDDAQRFERFFLVTGAAVDVEVVLQAARELAGNVAAETMPLQVPSLQTSELLVRK